MEAKMAVTAIAEMLLFHFATDPQHVIILGKTGAGKSSTMRLLVEDLVHFGRPVCVIDPKGDWWGIKLNRSGQGPGYPVIIFGGEHADIPLTVHAGAYVAELVATGNRPCIIDLGGWTVGDRTRFFVDFAQALFRHTRGPRWLCIDEVHNFAPQGKIMDPQAGQMLHWANRLASEGRGKGITLLSASQRPQKVHKDYVTSHETLIAMRVIHPLDRDAIKDWIDGCPDLDKGKEVLRSLASLKRGEAWVWSPESGFGPMRMQFPLFATYDSFAAPKDDQATKLKGWAAVDLEEIKAKLAAVVEEAKANDPAVLKAEIARLKRELSSATKVIDVETLRKAEEAGYQRGYDEGVATARTVKERMLEQAKLAIADLVTIADLAQLRPDPVTHAPNSRKISRTPPPSPAPPHHAPPPQAGNGDSIATLLALTSPQRELLAALAWWRDMGHVTITRAQLAAKAGWKAKGSHLRNRLSELRAIGMIEYKTGGIALAPAGNAVAPQPDLGVSLVDSIRAALNGPQREVFNALLELGLGSPAVFSRDELAERLGWDAAGSHLRNRLSELAAMEIVDYPARGQVALQGWVR
jgi:hypothetical protein